MTNKFFTLDDINDVIEVFEDFLRNYNIKIPESEKEKIENNDGNNDALIYGTVYGDLQYMLLEHFEELADKGKVAEVVNSWNAEVEEWGN